MSKDANSFGHDKALAWESRGFVYTKKRMHRFDTPSNSLRGFAWHKTIHYLCLHEENKPIGYCVVSNLHF